MLLRLLPLTAHPRKRRLISSSCEAPGEELDRGEVDHGGSRDEGCLEVFGQPVVAAEPSERPLDQQRLGRTAKPRVPGSRLTICSRRRSCAAAQAAVSPW